MLLGAARRRRGRGRDAARAAARRGDRRARPATWSSVGDDPREAAAGAHALYTDVWVSMGDEAEAAERRAAARALPARRASCWPRRATTRSCCTACRRIPGEEITEELLYGERSAVWDQAENRLHAQKALLELLLA